MRLKIQRLLMLGVLAIDLSLCRVGMYGGYIEYPVEFLFFLVACGGAVFISPRDWVTLIGFAAVPALYLMPISAPAMDRYECTRTLGDLVHFFAAIPRWSCALGGVSIGGVALALARSRGAIGAGTVARSVAIMTGGLGAALAPIAIREVRVGLFCVGPGRLVLYPLAVASAAQLGCALFRPRILAEMSTLVWIGGIHCWVNLWVLLHLLGIDPFGVAHHVHACGECVASQLDLSNLGWLLLSLTWTSLTALYTARANRRLVLQGG